jgi:multiphosphoryl transfer protein
MTDVALDHLRGWLGRFGVSGAHGDTVDELFKSAGLEAVNSLGPAYGSFFLRFGMTAGAVTSLDELSLGEALRGGLEGVVARGESALASELGRAIAAYQAAIEGGASAAAAASGAGTDLLAALAAALDAVTRTLEVVNPDGLHARPAALLVGALTGLDAAVTLQNLRTEKPPVAITGPTSILLLAARRGDRLLATASGADARPALDALAALLRGGFGELVDAAPPTRATPGPMGVSPGRAVGPVLRMPEPLDEPTSRRASAEVELPRIAAATAAVAAELRARAARVDGEARQILEAGALMATDASLIERATALAGHGAERALWVAVSEFADLLAAQGARMAERVSDLHDLRNRLVASLLGRPAPGVPTRSEPFVLVARDLAPADTALLRPETCLALVTEQGGPTSHTAILARSLGIPAIVAAQGAMSIAEGTVVLVDGTTGTLTQNPTAQQVDSVSAAPALAEFTGRGATRDGHPVQMLANVGSPTSVAAAVDATAEGIGLFRTEFCFLDRDTAPSVDEQVAAYRPVFAAFPGRKVVVRTLDAGADKPLAFATMADEQNPALGIRGIRSSWRHPELLDDQLRAIALAAAAEKATVWVMAPMVATVDEAEHFAASCARHGIASSGVMIETPAAAMLAPEIAAAVSFTSLGTNDLTQYTMAADRLVGELGALNDPWQPAVLRLVALAARASQAAGKPIGVCGEAAADPLLAAVLVGLGVGSLSMSPRAIAAVAATIGGLTLAQCESAAAAATSAATAAEARQAVVSIIG